MKKPWIKPVSILLIILAILFLLIICGKEIYQNYVIETRYHFFCVDLQKGMSKEEVKKAISEYGEYSWHEDDILGLSNIYMKGFFQMNVLGSPIVVKFDNYGLLQSMGSRYQLGDEIHLECNR
jgi:hypothetical protein